MKKKIFIAYHDKTVAEILSKLLKDNITDYSIDTIIAGHEYETRDGVRKKFSKEFSNIDLLVMGYVLNNKSYPGGSMLDLHDEFTLLKPNLKTIVMHVGEDFYNTLNNAAIKRGKHFIDQIVVPFNKKSILESKISKHLDSVSEHYDIIDKILNKLKDKLSREETEDLHSKLKNMRVDIDEDITKIEPSETGYTSKIGIEYKDLFIKVDTKARLKKEFMCYQWMPATFKQFMAEVVPSNFEVDDKTNQAIMIMQNLKYKESGISKAKKIYGQLIKANLNNRIAYNIFLMGLFHKEASGLLELLDPLSYEGIHEVPYYLETSIPFKNKTNRGYQNFKNTIIDISRILPIVSNYRTKQNIESDTVIHGDWKIENIVNGHLVDFSMIGRGFEVDEIAYFLSDAKYNTNLANFHRSIDLYANIRSSHDENFRRRNKNGYNKYLHSIADSALLTQLVLRHAVMNKRDMNDPEKFRQRQYYQHAINRTLKEGEFR